MPLPRNPKKPDYCRRIVLAIFVTIAYWRFAMPEGEISIGMPTSAYARETFSIHDPDESRKPDPAASKAPRKYDTFAHRVLDIDSEEAPVSSPKYALLDSIIDDAKNRIHFDPTEEDPSHLRAQAKKVLTIVDQILTDHNVLYPPGDYDVNSLRAGLTPQHYNKAALDRILRVHLNKRRREHAQAHATEAFYILDCDISSMVYVGVGEALGLNLHLVDLPDHMFVRWELPDGTHMNWDTNEAQIISDKEYASDYSLGKQIRKQRIYLASMTRRESEGYIYFLRATRFEDQDENVKAIADLVKARQMYPQSTQAASELAWLYATTQDIDESHRGEAIELAQSALDMEPKCGEFWDALAAAHAAIGEFKLAAKEARQAEILAESSEERAEFKVHRKTFEKGKMITGPRPSH